MSKTFSHAARAGLALHPLALALLLAIGAAQAADEDSAAETEPQVQADTLQKVTVTARRREENAQDVPTPITTLAGERRREDHLAHRWDLGVDDANGSPSRWVDGRRSRAR